MRKLVVVCTIALAFNMMVGSVHGGLDPSLVGWWTFDEGQGMTAYDSSGNGNDGTLTDGPEWTVGHLGGALSFPSTVNAFVEVPDSPELNPTEAITIAAWINPDAWTGNNRIMQKGSSDNQFRFLRENGDNFVMHLAGISNGRLEGFATPLAGEWTHVAGTYDGSALKVYYNAELVGEQAASGQISTSGDSLFIGTKHATAPVGDGFGGAMDDIRLYDRAVAQEEIPGIMRGIPPELASEPYPEDEAVDVLRSTLLAWAPGGYAVTHDVYLGTSFDDVNEASRDNPLGVLVSEGQSDATYTPPTLLEYGQTYYWRIDEVNGAPDNTIFKGEIWSFAVEPFVYAVDNIMATSNVASAAGVGPEKTVDGSGLNDQDQHSTSTGDMWQVQPAPGETVYIQYEFNGIYKLYEMLVWNYNSEFELVLGFGPKNVTVEYSTDGAEWTAFGDVELAQGTAESDYVANTTVAFNGVPVKYVRLTINSAYGVIGQYGLSEVRFLYMPANARKPEPADGATGVSVNTTLNWRAGREAVSHEVSLGTDPEALALLGTTTEASYTPDVLDLATSYYWRVDEVNEADEISTWEGLLWSFTTQEFLVVDDFESYNEEDHVIYEVWTDGWVNGTGSTVGYLIEPFTEQTIVHGGDQSMPLAYDNVEADTSEAELPLGQDWTASGIQSLSLFFYGDPDNSGGQLYVKIGGTQVVYDGDAAQMTEASWHEWNIDLAATGASLGNVSSLIVGIEGSGAQGIVYIDDIQLYPEVLE